MTTIAAGSSVTGFVPYAQTITFTPGTGGRISFNGRNQDGSAITPREIYAETAVAMAAGATFSAEAIGVDGTHTDIQSSVSGGLAYGEALLQNGSAGNFGSVICRWDATVFASGDASRAVRSTDDRTNPANMAMACPDPAARNVMSLTGNGSTFIYHQELLPAGVDATVVRTVGIWIRARRRSDGQPVQEVRVMLAQDNGSLTAINLSVRYAHASFSVPADGAWHYYVIPATASSGFLSTHSDAFIPGTGTVYRWIRVALETGTTAAPHGDPVAGSVVDFGAVYLNPRGARSAAIVRFDDGKSGFLDQMGANWASAFPSGFSGLSGVSISAAAGQVMTPMHLIGEFGFKANHFILTRHVGKPGFATLEELKRYEAEFGHKVCFQSHANPTSNFSHGVILLGPLGYSIMPSGSITSVTGTSLTWTAHPATSGTTNLSVGPQGFPVYFVAGTGLPAAVSAGQCVWLRYIDANTISVHPTEQDAGSNSNAIDFSGAVASTLSARYWGSANDGSAILADFQIGREYMRSNGLSGYMYCAPNQSAWDLYVEQAVRAVGFDGVWGGGAAVDWFQPAFAYWACVKQSTNQAHAWRVRVDPSLIVTMAAVGTDGLATTEANVRNAVRAFVKEGAVFQNIMHVISDPNQIKTLVWYLDELKQWSDAGMCYVDTVDKVSNAVKAVRA